MIFVTIGGDKRGFSRLIKLMDELAAEIKEEITFQIGNGQYKPKNGRYFDFVPLEEFKKIVLDSRVIVNDGGTGTIINALTSHKPIIIFHRLKAFGEVCDDHVIAFTKALRDEGKLHIARNKEQLKNLLLSENPKSFYEPRNQTNLVNALRAFLRDISKS